jgi:hypothetical protein
MRVVQRELQRKEVGWYQETRLLMYLHAKEAQVMMIHVFDIQFRSVMPNSILKEFLEEVVGREKALILA